MANILTDFKEKVKIDYQEWRSYIISRWNVSRDQRLIRRAINRARMKNKIDGRTYYIMRDKLGGINELNATELLFWTRRRLFSKEECQRRWLYAIAIVTINKVEYKQYRQIQNKQEQNE